MSCMVVWQKETLDRLLKKHDSKTKCPAKVSDLLRYLLMCLLCVGFLYTHQARFPLSESWPLGFGIFTPGCLPHNAAKPSEDNSTAQPLIHYILFLLTRHWARFWGFVVFAIFCARSACNNDNNNNNSRHLSETEHHSLPCCL